VLLSVDEMDIASVAPGQIAKLKLDALPGQTFDGVVNKVMPVGTRVNNMTTYDVELFLPAPAGALPYMSVSGDILTASAQSTLIVPVAALQTIGQERYVMICPTDADLEAVGKINTRGAGGGFMSMFQPSNATADLQALAPQLMRKVEVGLIGGEYAQLLSGINEGDVLVLPRSNSNLFSAMMNMGGGRR